ncbi:MAG: signal peptidase I [Dehalococcoidia bacterium]
MRFVRLLALSCGAFFVVVAACGGDRPETSRAGQSDYAQRALAALSLCGSTSASPTVQPVADRLAREAAALLQLTPPPDLAVAQQRLVAALRKMAAALSTMAGGETVSPGSRVQSDTLTAVAAANEWNTQFSRHYSANLFKNEGPSMQPTLRNGDIVAAKPVAAPIERWQIIVFRFPLDTTRDFIKRVVGLPGDTVEVRDGAVLINGTRADGDAYALAQTNYTYGPKTVPPAEYFVLGDNRNNSYDSHAWHAACSQQQTCDFVPANLILGVLPADTRSPCLSHG